ncbi:MAG: hypothetical protein BWY26_01451 [Elusimicrobia bacterium ADurb.Bin231]|nr:MAG: hypothetical protein BWY26_01451 [Elusimicrobia bacterium ADurb.Bin231]
MKNKKVLIIAGILGLFAAVLTIGLISSLEQKYRRGAQMVEVLVAKGYVSEGTLLTQYMVDTIKVPLEYRMPKALESVSQIVNEEGAGIYATVVPIEGGEQIVSTKLVTAGKETGLAIVIPEGKRAVTILVDAASGVADLIKPGNTVDVICTLEEQNRSVTVLQDVLVLATKQNVIGSSSIKASAVSGGGELADMGTVPDADLPESVTIAVTPQEAQVLSLSSAKGILRLSLRGLNDRVTTKVGSTGLEIFSR